MRRRYAILRFDEYPEPVINTKTARITNTLYFAREGVEISGRDARAFFITPDDTIYVIYNASSLDRELEGYVVDDLPNNINLIVRIGYPVYRCGRGIAVLDNGVFNCYLPGGGTRSARWDQVRPAGQVTLYKFRPFRWRDAGVKPRIVPRPYGAYEYAARALGVKPYTIIYDEAADLYIITNEETIDGVEVYYGLGVIWSENRHFAFGRLVMIAPKWAGRIVVAAYGIATKEDIDNAIREGYGDDIYRMGLASKEHILQALSTPKNNASYDSHLKLAVKTLKTIRIPSWAAGIAILHDGQIYPVKRGKHGYYMRKNWRPLGNIKYKTLKAIKPLLPILYDGENIHAWAHIETLPPRRQPEPNTH